MKWLLIIILSVTYLDSFAGVQVVTTDAHHHSVQHWLKRQLSIGDLLGLPILHFDSHSDMGFIPAHYLYKGSFQEARGLVDNLSLPLIEAFQNSLTDISQVLVPALTTGLTKDIHMCMPPWFKRVPKNEELIEFSVPSLNSSQFVGAKVDRVYPVTKKKNSFLESPFYHSKKLGGDDFSIRFYDCFNKPQLKIKSDYILSLDLDILSSNGVHGDHARPISTARGEKNEEKLFKARIEKIKAILLELRAKGFNPRIVTIAKSSGEIGGSYTPSEFAHKADLEFREFFRKNFN